MALPERRPTRGTDLGAIVVLWDRTLTTCLIRDLENAPGGGWKTFGASLATGPRRRELRGSHFFVTVGSGYGGGAHRPSLG